MINALADFHFIRPGGLLLAPLAIALWWVWQRESDPLRGWREQIKPELLKPLIVGGENTQQLSVWWVLVTWLMAVVAIAGPTWKLEPSPFADASPPLMIVLKADVSMKQPDPTPSRLERAKLKIADLAEKLKGRPLGLVVYAGSAHLVLPPTRDTAVVARMANEISPDIMPVQGDRLDLALVEAARVLAEGKKGGSFVVIADAAKTDAAALQGVAKRLNVPVQFLAVNTSGSKEDSSLQAAARVLDANMVPFDVDSRDVTAIARRAARAPVAIDGSNEGRWQETGYWLVPLLCLMALAAFRRQSAGEKTA